MRRSVKSTEVFHLWANEAQAEAYCGSIRFNGPSAYSYAMEIGRIVRNARGEKAFLVNNTSRISTTSGHQSALRRAIPSGETVFAYPDVFLDNSECLRAMVSELPDLQSAANRARSNKAWKLQQLQYHVDLINAWATFFDLPHTPITIEGIDAAISEANTRYETEQTAAWEREEARQTARIAELMELLPAWLAGGTGYSFASIGYLPTAYLRLSPYDPEETETSRGATVPTAHIRKALPLVLRVLNGNLLHGDNSTPILNNTTIRLGHYSLSHIESDGTVVVGCHRFAAEEVRRFAALLADMPLCEAESA